MTDRIACIDALDFLPGCNWPLWLQLVVGFSGYLALMMVLPRPWGWRRYGGAK